MLVILVVVLLPTTMEMSLESLEFDTNCCYSYLPTTYIRSDLLHLCLSYYDYDYDYFQGDLHYFLVV